MPTFPGHTTVRETLVSYGSSRPGQLPVVRSRQFLPDHRLTVALSLNDPSLQLHYRAFLTTTSDSAPVLRLGTLAEATCLTGSLHIGATGSHVPYGSQDHAPSMPDAGIIGHPPTLSQEHSWFRRRQKMFRHVIRGSLSLVSVPDRYRLPFPQRSRQWLFAAWGGLKPAPESRLRYP